MCAPLKLYPAITPADHTPLNALEAVDLNVGPGEQRNFVSTPEETRVYRVRTFGASDAVVVLFEEERLPVSSLLPTPASPRLVSGHQKVPKAALNPRPPA